MTRIDVDALREQIDLEVLARVDAGECGCGCGRPLGRGGNGRARFAGERCRQRHHRAKLRRLADAAGVPARLSLTVLEAMRDTGKRRRNAQRVGKRRRRTGETVYLEPAAVDWLRALVDEAETDPERAVVLAAIDKTVKRRQVRA